MFGLKITHKSALPSIVLMFLHLFVNYTINHVKYTENQVFHGQIFVQNGQNLLFIAMATTFFSGENESYIPCIPDKTHHISNL